MNTIQDLIAKRVLDNKLRELEDIKQHGSGEDGEVKAATEELAQQVDKFRSLGVDVPELQDLDIGVGVGETGALMRQAALTQLKEKLAGLSADAEVQKYMLEKHCHAIVRRFMQHKNTLEREFEYVTYQQIYKNVSPQFRKRFELALNILVRLGIVHELITKGKIRYRLNAKGVL